MPLLSSWTQPTTPTRPRSNGETSPSPTGPSYTWGEALGAGWQFQLALCALCLFAAGALQPLADPDLPIHLAAGEWVVRHRSVPVVEPWAWSRQGGPFQAYSWAIETAYYLILARVGPWGLHILQGIVYVALAGAIVALGSVARWRPWTTIAVCGVQVVVVTAADPYLRPQATLAVVTPLVWALVLRSRDVERLRWELPALLFLSAIVANTHLLIPILLAPCVFLFTDRPRVVLRRMVVPLVIVLGWLLTPYAFQWPAIYRLNFAPNAMVGPPAIIAEYKPGFTLALRGGAVSLLVPVAFLVLPWLAATLLTRVQRLLHGILWLGGALLFVLAARAILVWWLVIIPVVAGGIELLPLPTLRATRRAQRFALIAVAVLFGLKDVDRLSEFRLSEGTPSWRTLPSVNARAMEPIAEWLDCVVRPTARGRLVTTFAFGGYVPWRLPYLSESVDGRTIFPDSVAKAETYFFPSSPNLPLQPWRTSDLAIAPVGFPLATVLDTATGWHRVAVTGDTDGSPTAGLWVTERWWTVAGAVPLPEHPITLSPRPSRPQRPACRG